MDRQTLGKRGEDLAAEYLEGLGWRVVERRWRCAAGEVDLVAVEPGERPVTVFCEVKTRSGLGFGEPLEAITRAKMARLRILAAQWMRERHPRTMSRVDGIGILLRPGWDPLITHVRGIS
ncbi:YraN family protein [Propionicicella superfundia]|uniref:YraN family protein n=1 Tax=Propionicicella superfundia TaxID=348582 RepID=UPI0003F99CEE|nr:YraN family protein [Propionicicella superfundia]